MPTNYNAPEEQPPSPEETSQAASVIIKEAIAVIEEDFTPLTVKDLMDVNQEPGENGEFMFYGNVIMDNNHVYRFEIKDAIASLRRLVVPE